MSSLIQFAAGEHVNQVGDDTLQNDIKNILSAIIGVLGFVSVAVMIVGGVNYITSSGDTAKLEKAKKTILYGLIGLIVAALAFAIVQFVIGNILGSSNQVTCGEGTHYDVSSGTCLGD